MLAIAAAWGLPALFEKAAGVSPVGKVAICLGLISPLAALMGVLFPWGLARLAQRAEAAVPLAWAVNGFASVVSASAAVLLVMVYGFHTLLALAAAIYVSAGVLGLGILSLSASITDGPTGEKAVD